jgi:LysM repeat protein
VKKIIIMIVAFLVALIGITKMVQSQESFACNGSVITVAKGDTLWGIIEDNCTGNWESARMVLVKQYGTDLRVGQVIQLP